MKKAKNITMKISRYIPSSSQAKLNLFVTERRVSLAMEHGVEPRIRQALFAFLVAFFFLYLFFVSASILNIMARKEANANTTALQSAVARMQGEYFALSERLDSSTAGTIGLAPVAETHYVYRPGNAASAAAKTTDRMGGNAI